MWASLARRAVMRRIHEVAFPVLLVACAPAGSESQTIQPPEAAPTIATAPPVETASTVEAPPELVARPPVDPSTQPKLEVVPRKLDGDQRDLGYCRFQVQLHAFPAISDDGTTLVAAQNIEIFPKDVYVELTWLGADGT